MGSCDQVSLPSKAMESFKVSVCMCLLVGLAQSAPQNTNEVVRTVTTQLQPLISDAVARALASLNTVTTVSSSNSGFGSSSSFGASSGAAVARGSGLTEQEELEYNRKLSANAAYENGYTETRDVQEGAVVMRNIPGPWTGPLAGVDNVATTAAKAAPAPRPAPRLVAPAAPAVDQSALIRLILQQLQPQISSAVQTAVSSSRTVSAPVSQVAVASGPEFFAGDNSVRIQTPEFNIEY